MKNERFNKRRFKKKIIDSENVIEIYDDFMNYTFTFYYVYSGDSQEAVFLNKKFF